MPSLHGEFSVKFKVEASNKAALDADQAVTTVNQAQSDVLAIFAGQNGKAAAIK